MTLMWLICGLVLAVLFFLYWRRQWNKSSVKDKTKNKNVSCPNCGVDMAKVGRWLRSRALGGEIFKCAICEKKSVWDLDQETPTIIR